MTFSSSPAYLVTGGAGFIGSHFVRSALARTTARIVTLDKLTYAGNVANLPQKEPRHCFVRGDIGDSALVSRLFEEHRPAAVVHFAAETHVDRSIDGPRTFVDTNVVGTLTLLEAARQAHARWPVADAAEFRFIQVSTDEVFGSLGATGAFSEDSPYAPRSPYAASKAAADHLARAFHHTYGLPTIITISSNNFGPFQFPEKLIPLMILNALEGKALPLYGDGLHERDWLYVEDHCDALHAVLERGLPGQTYAIGSGRPLTNLEVVERLAHVVARRSARNVRELEALIAFVADRPGHDRRYAIDSSKVQRELGWRARLTFDEGLERTVGWYIDNGAWCGSVAHDRQRLGA